MYGIKSVYISKDLSDGEIKNFGLLFVLQMPRGQPRPRQEDSFSEEGEVHEGPSRQPFLRIPTYETESEDKDYIPTPTPISESYVNYNASVVQGPSRLQTRRQFTHTPSDSSQSASESVNERQSRREREKRHLRKRDRQIKTKRKVGKIKRGEC